mmetsp:Transcript_39401/g.95293  ORF Transcript_39401/g.95293 Transcript_39401/m.95293 type:complete len:203 (-) Transcript_39401:23-631(-)
MRTTKKMRTVRWPQTIRHLLPMIIIIVRLHHQINLLQLVLLRLRRRRRRRLNIRRLTVRTVQAGLLIKPRQNRYNFNVEIQILQQIMKVIHLALPLMTKTKAVLTPSRFVPHLLEAMKDQNRRRQRLLETNFWLCLEPLHHHHLQPRTLTYPHNNSESDHPTKAKRTIRIIAQETTMLFVNRNRRKIRILILRHSPLTVFVW